MTANEIIDKINETAFLSNPNVAVSTKQLSQIAAVINTALKSIGVVDGGLQKRFRIEMMGLVAGRKIASSKELLEHDRNKVIALVSRWTQVDNPFQPSPECLSDVAVLVREVALREGQTELPL